MLKKIVAIFLSPITAATLSARPSSATTKPQQSFSSLLLLQLPVDKPGGQMFCGKDCKITSFHLLWPGAIQVISDYQTRGNFMCRIKGIHQRRNFEVLPGAEDVVLNRNGEGRPVQ